MDAVCSGIVVYGGGDIVLWCKKIKPVDAVTQWIQWMQYAWTEWMQWNSGIWWCVCCVLHPVHLLV